MGAIAFDNKSDNTGGSVRFFYNFGEHNLSDGFHSRDKNFGIISYQAFELFEGNTFTVGADYKRYGGIAENIKALNGKGILFGDTSVWEMAGYAFVQQELFRKLIINAGFRLDHHSVFGNEPVPTGGLMYHLTSSTTLKASISKGFRSPTIRELYLFTPANANLKPERMMNYETGILYKSTDNRLSLEATLFKAKGDNLIQTVMGASGPQNQNTGEFSNTGVELAGSLKPDDKFTLNANYSYISMKEPIIASPQQQLFVSGTYKVKGFTLNASLQHIHNLFTQLKPRIRESFSLLNSRIGYIFNRNVDLFVKGENLTNKKYQINYGYPMPGILFFGGLNLHF
jgi:iron complex outermembrane receptor protein